MSVEDVKQQLKYGDSRFKEVEVASRRDRYSLAMAAQIADEGNPHADRIRKAVGYVFSDLKQEVKGVVEENVSGRAEGAALYYRQALIGSDRIEAGAPDDPIMLSMRTQFTAEKLLGLAAAFPEFLDAAQKEVLAAVDRTLGDIALRAQQMVGLTEDIAAQSQEAVAASQAVSEHM